jgi:hypothetical protein
MIETLCLSSHGDLQGVRPECVLVFINKMFSTFYFDLRFKCHYSINHASYRLETNTIRLRRPELVTKDLKNCKKSKIKKLTFAPSSACLPRPSDLCLL